MPDARIGLAIIICTFKRNDLLRQALQSLATQSVPAELSPTIYVVDNSDDGMASNVVDEMAATCPIPIRWIEAHPANISVARNVGVRASSEDFVAFIDDDETCEPGWLQAIASAAAYSSYDVFFGQVRGRFESPHLASAAVRQLFAREMDAREGTELFAFGLHKRAGITLATCNSIFRRATTLTEVDPFEVAFGAGGGEDYDLFCRLQRRGCRFGWLPSASVIEFVPQHRCDKSYLRKRFYAGGQSYAAAIARTSDNSSRTRWTLRLKAVAQGAALLTKFPQAYIGGREAIDDYEFRWAGVLGKMSFGSTYPLYHSEKR